MAPSFFGRKGRALLLVLEYTNQFYVSFTIYSKMVELVGGLTGIGDPRDDGAAERQFIGIFQVAAKGYTPGNSAYQYAGRL